MRRLLLIGAIVILTPIALYALGSLILGQPQVLEMLLGPIQRTPVDFATLQLKESPNQYLVCPENNCAAQAHEAAPTFDEPAEQLRDRWDALMAETSRVSLIERSGDGMQATYQALTPVIGWPDSITVRFYPVGEGRSTLAIYSRSHYGYSDLDENKKRIQRWLAGLTGG